MGASGAKYGIATSHFYWVGAIPAMVFVGIFMMPFYYGSRARSVPEYLKLRFDEKTRSFNAVSFAADDDLLLGHLDVRDGAAVQSAARLGLRRQRLVVGGDRARLHPAGRADQRDLQRSASVLSDRLRLRAAGVARVCTTSGAGTGFSNGWRKWPPRAASRPAHTPTPGAPGQSRRESDGGRMVRPRDGPGFVLSFGYWCTDFLVVQRAMAADSMTAARRTPLIAAMPKMFFPFLVILPGMIALALGATRRSGPGLVPAKLAADGLRCSTARARSAGLRSRHSDDAGALLPRRACSASGSRR